jgi:putative FmdB family regulatory protein
VPTYQYSCNDCGHFFEIVQSFSDDSLTVCPECEGRLRKVFHAVGVVFKGSGNDRTDSRSHKTGAESGASSESGSSNGSSGSDSGKDSDKGSGNGKESGGDKKSAATPSGSSSSAAPTPA